MSTTNKIGIRQAREAIQMSIVEFASKLNVDASVARAWENGVSSIPLVTLIKMSKLLNVTIEQLLFSETRKALDLSQLTTDQMRIILLLYQDFKKNEEDLYGYSR